MLCQRIRALSQLVIDTGKAIGEGSRLLTQESWSATPQPLGPQPVVVQSERCGYSEGIATEGGRGERDTSGNAVGAIPAVQC